MIGERIRQARLLAGLTQEALANAISDAGHPATKAVISKYENSKSIPTAQFLILASSILDVPASYFTYEPTLDVTWSAFRRHSTLANRDQEAVKAYAANVAELQIELQTLLHPDSAPSLPEVMSVKSFDEAEQTAERLRKHWELDEHPIDSLVQTAEDHQVVVVAWRQHADEFDGLSGWCNERYPVTVISTIGETDRRRFTLAHELGHLIMDTESVSDKDAEKLAHRFAAALIVPANRASHELGTRRTRLDFEELSILKRKYGLSIAAWIYRAKDLGIISENHAGNLYRELSQRGWRKKEPVDYIGDEVPLKLDQMAHHAVAEGLISPDQIRRIYPNWVEKEVSQPSSGRITVYELLNLSEGERQAVLEEAYRLAANEEFETFEANEFLEENTGVE